MPYSEVMFYSDQLHEERHQKYKNNMKFAAFEAWQILTYQKLIKLDWEKYLIMLGLKEKVIVSKEQLIEEGKRALAGADRTIEIMRKRQAKKNG